jgi:5-(carboxyamino)imidazole ribonucleotide mutase
VGQQENEMAQVAIVMGSRSDWATMEEAAQMLDRFAVSYDVAVVSAHRTPQKLVSFAEGAEGNGYQIIIAGAGGAAHLPGMIAAMTPLPVLGVPVQSKALSGLDSLLSIVQMPKGVAVGTLAIGAAGAANAGLLAAQILSNQDAALRQRIVSFRHSQTQEVLDHADPRLPL